MTDRIHALTITLDRDMRSDDVRHVVDAIQMIKFVQSVDPHVTDTGDHCARMRIASEVETKLVQTIRELFRSRCE